MLMALCPKCPALPWLLPGALASAEALPLVASAQPVFQEGAGDPDRRPPASAAGPVAPGG